MQHALIVRQAQHRDDALVVTAVDPAQRAFVGRASGRGAARDFVFTQVDRVTLLELERGELDVETLMAERCSGIVVQATGWGKLDEVMRGAIVQGSVPEV